MTGHSQVTFTNSQKMAAQCDDKSSNGDALNDALVTYAIQQAMERRERVREASSRRAAGVVDLPWQQDQLLRDQEAGVQDATVKHWMVGGDILFGLQMQQQGDTIPVIYQTIACLCEARMDGEILQVLDPIATDEIEMDRKDNQARILRSGRVPTPETDTHDEWQRFLHDQVLETSALADWKCRSGPASLALEETTNEDGSPKGLIVPMQRGSWVDEEDQAVPTEVDRLLDLCEMSEDMDRFDLDADTEHLMRHGNVCAGGPAEELGMRMDLHQQLGDNYGSTAVATSIGVEASIIIGPVPFVVTKVGKDYHTVTWKYGKAFLGKYDLPHGGASGCKTLRLAGGALKWRVCAGC